ncbi:MAG: hypothetical protein ACN6P8_12830 [Achromobacter piechaudii]
MGTAVATDSGGSVGSAGSVYLVGLLGSVCLIGLLGSVGVGLGA